MAERSNAFQRNATVSLGFTEMATSPDRETVLSDELPHPDNNTATIGAIKNQRIKLRIKNR